VVTVGESPTEANEPTGPSLAKTAVDLRAVLVSCDLGNQGMTRVMTSLDAMAEILKAGGLVGMAEDAGKLKGQAELLAGDFETLKDMVEYLRSRIDALST